MKERFEGQRGRELLIEALKEQRLVQHDHEIASRFADAAVLNEYKPGDVLVAQSSSDNSLLLIISGEVAIAINGRNVASRSAGESIGEMTLASPGAPRSATVTAVKPTLIALLSEERFAEVASAFPHIWKPIAKVVCERLRQREKFHRLPNPMPVVFVGSSVEGLPIARAIVDGLKHDKIVTRLWSTPGLFSPGGTPLDTLLKEVEIADFALFVFGPDDKISSREATYNTPRDNVIFELGLFMGRLDRERSLIVREHRSDIKIPSDLLAVTTITFVSKPGQDLPSTVEPVCNDVRRAVEKHGAL